MQVRFLPGASNHVRRKKGVWMTAKNNNTPIHSKVKDFIVAVPDFLKSHKKQVGIVAFFIVMATAITVITVKLAASEKEEQQVLESIVLDETVQDADVLAAANAEIPVPQDPLQENAYETVNDLVGRYYKALEAGDVDAIVTMKSFVKDTEKIRIETKKKYIESYQNIVCYTKAGPEANSYLVYAYYEAKLIGIDTLAPGLNPMYLRTDESGKLYIYDGELADNELAYMEAIAEQEDVVDLLTRVSVLYSDSIALDENLKLLMASLQSELDTTVGETIAALEAAENPVTEEVTQETVTDPATTDENAVAGVTEAPATQAVKATTTVNVRSSDSETADKIGKVAAGTELTRLEEKPNGWSKVLYEEKEGYVKTEFLTVLTTEEGEAVIGTVVAKSNVNIRAEASETAEKVGVAYQGEELNLVEKQADGWCRINYNGKTAYVKTEFVQE